MIEAPDAADAGLDLEDGHHDEDGEDSDGVADEDTLDAETGPPELPAPVCEDCDDGLDCTSDGCGVDGICRHVVREGFCAISGRCVTAGFGSQCQVCAPQVDPTRYTPLTGGPCDDGDPCTEGEQCLGGICRGGVALSCPPPPACHASLGCSKQTDGCAIAPLPDGTVCGPGLVCRSPEPDGPDEPGDAPTCAPGDPFPVGTVAFFDRSSCPPGWALAPSLVGRTPIASGAETVGQIRGEPLLSGEDRRHTHTFAGDATAAAVSFAGVVGGGNGLAAAGTLSVTAVDTGASSNLPYLQLLPCEKTLDDQAGALPDGLTLMSTSATCPGDTVLALTAWGRLIVSTPAGGTSGASFGSAPNAGATTSHTHALTGTIPTPSHGIALASGCCGGGYASSAGLAATLSSTASEVVFPTLSVLLCELPPAPSTPEPEPSPDAAPPGMVLWSQSAACPPGWSVHTTSQGRLIVGAGLGGDVGLTVNTPLGDREDRTHTHPVTLTATLTRRNIAAADGTNRSGANFGEVTATLTSAPASSGQAFVQRLACVKDAVTAP